MGRVIDLDEGYSIRIHPVMGMDIYMKKSEPGVFLNGHGDEIAAQLAAEAGFPVEMLLKEKERLAKIGEASAAINKLYADAREKVVKQRRGYALVDIGYGRFVVKDPQGHALNANPVAEAVAGQLFDQVVPPDKDENKQK